MKTRTRLALYGSLVALNYAICLTANSKIMVAVIGLAGLLWAVRLGALIQEQWPRVFSQPRIDDES